MGEEVRLNFICPKIQAKIKPQQTEIKFVAYYLPLKIFFISVYVGAFIVFIETNCS